MDKLLESNRIDEFGDIIIIAPHAQFPVTNYNAEGKSVEWSAKMDIDHTNEAMKMVELFGRCCYKSEDRITAESADRFVTMIIKSGHESVLEHLNFTVKYVGSRAMSHQLVRHRIAAYSQESQRYCNYERSGKLYCIAPPSIVDKGSAFMSLSISSLASAYDAYRDLVENGINAEDARHVLPNACKTEVVTTFNIRQWRHVIQHRGLNPKAQWEIRNITLMVLQEFARCMPAFFGDLL